MSGFQRKKKKVLAKEVARNDKDNCLLFFLKMVSRLMIDSGFSHRQAIAYSLNKIEFEDKEEEKAVLFYSAGVLFNEAKRAIRLAIKTNKKIEDSDEVKDCMDVLIKLQNNIDAANVTTFMLLNISIATGLVPVKEKEKALSLVKKMYPGNEDIAIEVIKQKERECGLERLAAKDGAITI